MMMEGDGGAGRGDKFAFGLSSSHESNHQGGHADHDHDADDHHDDYGDNHDDCHDRLLYNKKVG